MGTKEIEKCREESADTFEHSVVLMDNSVTRDLDDKRRMNGTVTEI